MDETNIVDGSDGENITDGLGVSEAHVWINHVIFHIYQHLFHYFVNYNTYMKQQNSYTGFNHYCSET